MAEFTKGEYIVRKEFVSGEPAISITSENRSHHDLMKLVVIASTAHNKVESMGGNGLEAIKALPEIYEALRNCEVWFAMQFEGKAQGTTTSERLREIQTILEAIHDNA